MQVRKLAVLHPELTHVGTDCICVPSNVILSNLKQHRVKIVFPIHTNTSSLFTCEE